MTHVVSPGLVSDRFPFCLICDELIVEPVTLPCGHELCFDCFKDCMESANFSCCVCRKRVSTWARRHHSNPVNTERKEALNKLYTSMGPLNDIKLAAQLQKEEDNKTFTVVKCEEVGELKKEYLQELRQIEQEKESEEKLSVIEVQRCQIEADEFRCKRLAQIAEDEKLARTLSKAEKESSIQRVMPIDVKINRTPSDNSKYQLKPQKAKRKYRNLPKRPLDTESTIPKLTKWFSPKS